MNCTFPRCECMQHPKDCPFEREGLQGKCHALWLLNGNETGKWNGEGCNCEYIQGNLNCKLNPF